MGTAVEQAVPALQEALRGDADPRVRGLAARALAQTGHGPQADAVLVQALSDPDRGVREEAVRALGSMPDSHAAHVVPALRRVVQQDEAPLRILAVQALSRMRPSGLAAVIAALGSGDPIVRAAAIDALAQRGAEAAAAVPKLKQLSTHENDPTIAAAAAGAVHRIEEALQPPKTHEKGPPPH